jgi:hypothetical protein
MPTTTEATPLPLDTAARRRLRHFTIDPPFRCAPALSSLLGTLPVAPSRSPATSCRCRATVEPPASMPLRRPARGARALQQAAQAVCSAGLLGHGPAGLSTDRAWQATAPHGL